MKGWLRIGSVVLNFRRSSQKAKLRCIGIGTPQWSARHWFWRVYVIKDSPLHEFIKEWRKSRELADEMEMARIRNGGSY